MPQHSEEFPSCLRLLTYLVPGLPLELYQTYQYYLEETLDIPVRLMVESRWSGPPADRQDPFTTDQADIAFMCSTGYLSLVEKEVTSCELLPSAPVHVHPKSDLQPVYFSDVVVHADNSHQYRDFSSLQGCRFGYNDCVSLSGNFITQIELHKRGLDNSFFGKLVKTGSHHNSIASVLNHEIDGAAIDANTLAAYLRAHPRIANKLHVVCSWGPMPIQPLVVNTRLADKMKHALTDAFLNINRHPKWQTTLDKFQVWGFKPVTHTDYDIQAIKSALMEASEDGGTS